MIPEGQILQSIRAPPWAAPVPEEPRSLPDVQRIALPAQPVEVMGSACNEGFDQDGHITMTVATLYIPVKMRASFYNNTRCGFYFFELSKFQLLSRFLVLTLGVIAVSITVMTRIRSSIIATHVVILDTHAQTLPSFNLRRHLCSVNLTCFGTRAVQTRSAINLRSRCPLQSCSTQTSVDSILLSVPL